MHYLNIFVHSLVGFTFVRLRSIEIKREIGRHRMNVFFF